MPRTLSSLWDCKYLKKYFSRNNFRKILAFLAIFASKLTENRPGYDYFPGVPGAPRGSIFHLRTLSRTPVRRGCCAACAFGHVVRRSGLYPDADVEDFPHTAAQYRGAGADFRCRAGGGIRPRGIPVDYLRRYLHGGGARLHRRDRLAAQQRCEFARDRRHLPRAGDKTTYAHLFRGADGARRRCLPVAARFADRQPHRGPGAVGYCLRQFLVVAAHHSGRYPDLLYRGDVAARGQDHRPYLSGFRLRTAFHGAGNPRRIAFQRQIYDPRVYLPGKLHCRPGAVPDPADALYDHRLRRYFRASMRPSRR